MAKIEFQKWTPVLVRGFYGWFVFNLNEEEVENFHRMGDAIDTMFEIFGEVVENCAKITATTDAY